VPSRGRVSSQFWCRSAAVGSYRKRARMKLAITISLLCGVLAGPPVADAPKIERPHWVIVATVIDRSTGAALRQGLMTGPGMRFDDLRQCEAALEKAQPVATDEVALVFTCEQVGPRELAV
jgi:hypothetical protein